jgi:hypothetical protein
MKKKLVVLFILLKIPIFADEARGFTATVDIDVNAFQLRSKIFSDENDRQFAHNVTTIENLPFGNFNWIEDTSVSFSYQGTSYGGTLSLDDKDGIGGIKVWVKFGSLFKITAGNDIGAGFADSLDADPGMRIYTGSTPAEWDASKDPDNITQDSGILLEAFPGDFTLAFAGQYYNGSTLSLEVDPTVKPQQTENYYSPALHSFSQYVTIREVKIGGAS